MELLLGILAGVMLSLFFSFGPAFFALMQTSIQYGYRRAMPFPIGVAVSDAVVVFLLLTVLKNVDMYMVVRNPYFATIASVLMITMGVVTMRKKVQQSTREKASVKFRVGKKASPRAIFFNAFLINIVNPLIWVYWLAVIALISGEWDVPTGNMYLFFAGLLSTTLGLDILKCKLASKLQHVITAKLLNIFNRITAAIFFAFASYLIISMLVFQLNPDARERQMEKDHDPQSIQVVKDIRNGIKNMPIYDSNNVKNNQKSTQK